MLVTIKCLYNLIFIIIIVRHIFEVDEHEVMTTFPLRNCFQLRYIWNISNPRPGLNHRSNASRRWIGDYMSHFYYLVKSMNIFEKSTVFRKSSLKLFFLALWQTSCYAQLICCSCWNYMIESQAMFHAGNWTRVMAVKAPDPNFDS